MPGRTGIARPGTAGHPAGCRRDRVERREQGRMAEYDESELEIALNPNHPRHILPPALPSSFKVLDVGCGAGQTLLAAYPDRQTVGVDVSREALKAGRSLTDKTYF